MDPLSLNIRCFGPLELAPVEAPSQLELGPDQEQAGGDRQTQAPAPRSAQSLLAYLILRHDHAIPREKLAGLFWPERATHRARRALSHTLWQIRRALGPAADRIMTEHDTVTFAFRPGDQLDVEQFEQRVEACIRGSNISGEHTRQLEEAVALYRADFLQGIYDDWALVERERLRERHLLALERLMVTHKQRGDLERALAYAQQLAASDPLREAAHRELMRLYYLLDRPRAALEQFTTLCDVLEHELGGLPTPATAALHQNIAESLNEPREPHLPLVTPPPILRNERQHALTHLPFVGRVLERTKLLEALEAAGRGHGGAALVEGEAGVGKSRLMNEIVADARWRGFQSGFSKADPYVTRAPYRLLRDALSALLTPLRVAQLAELVAPQWLAAAAPVLPSLTEYIPRLPALVSLPLDGEQQRLCRGLIRCVTGLSSIAPLLIVLEDIHWADETTLRALPALVSGFSTGRTITILTCRSGEARTRQTVWKALQALDRALPIMRTRVSPFDLAEVISLVQRALGADEKDTEAAELGRRLQAETGGNALFLVESLESLLDQGSLKLADGRWRFPSEDLPLPTPASVRELITHRMTHLPVALQDLLEHVAVTGEDADFAILSETTSIQAAELSDQLRRLDEQGFLTETDTGYRFEHDVMRDVVYQSIPIQRRKALHRRAGKALEEYRPSRIESLAVHFERGEIWPKAVDAYRQAGERARALYAGDRAIQCYDRALVAWRRIEAPDENLGMRLHQERGRIYQDKGWFDQAEADFLTARRLAEHVGDEAGEAQILNHLSYLRFQRGDFGAADRMAQRALETSTNIRHDLERATAHFNRANALRNQGAYQEAIDLYGQAASIFETLDSETRLADCLNRMGAAFNHIGDFLTARHLIERSLAIRGRVGDRLGVSYSLINLAMNHGYRGRFDRMREAAQEALEIATEIEDLYGQDAALHDLGVAALEQGLALEAVPFFQRALTIAREIGDRALEPEVLAEMGRAHLQLGNLDKAGELLEQALGLVTISIEMNYVPQLHAFLALFYLATGQVDRARDHARTSIEEADDQADPWAQGFAHRVMGQVIEHLRQDAIESRPTNHFERAITIQRRIGAQAELARTLAAYGLHLSRSSDSTGVDRSDALLEEARTLFEELGMVGDLSRLEEQIAHQRQPGQMTVRIAKASAPIGRPLHDDEYVETAWTVTAPEDAQICGKAARRRHRILRLLREAAEQSAAPTLDDLAKALDVSVSTIKRDLAALREAGHRLETRGRRR